MYLEKKINSANIFSVFAICPFKALKNSKASFLYLCITPYSKSSKQYNYVQNINKEY